jgi:coenzyme Q-binding protein COQ10
MPTHAERRTLPYTTEQLYALVADVERYPEFLPWCRSCRIKSRAEEGRVLHADLVIGYKMFQEKIVSKVTLTPFSRVQVEYADGPLRYLSNHWNFIQNDDGTATIDFYVDFEFRNPMFQKLMGVFFHEIVRRMVSAFEERAKALYG